MSAVELPFFSNPGVQMSDYPQLNEQEDKQWKKSEANASRNALCSFIWQLQFSGN